MARLKRLLFSSSVFRVCPEVSAVTLKIVTVNANGSAYNYKRANRDCGRRSDRRERNGECSRVRKVIP
jgi:hypothetical protein